MGQTTPPVPDKIRNINGWYATVIEEKDNEVIPILLSHTPPRPYPLRLQLQQEIRTEDFWYRVIFAVGLLSVGIILQYINPYGLLGPACLIFGSFLLLQRLQHVALWARLHREQPLHLLRLEPEQVQRLYGYNNGYIALTAAEAPLWGFSKPQESWIHITPAIARYIAHLYGAVELQVLLFEGVPTPMAYVVGYRPAPPRQAETDEEQAPQTSQVGLSESDLKLLQMPLYKHQPRWWRVFALGALIAGVIGLWYPYALIDDAQQRVRQAVRKKDKVAYRRAIRRLQQRQPGSAMLFALQGDWHYAHRRYTAALTQYKMAITKGASKERYYYRIGRIYMARKEYKQALHSFQRTLKHKPCPRHMRLVALRIGQVYQRQHRWKAAFRQYAMAHRRFPRYRRLQQKYADMALKLGHHRLAMRQYHALLWRGFARSRRRTSKKTMADIYSGLAQSYINMEKFALATRYSIRALSLAPKRPSLQEQRAYLHMQAQETRQALLLLEPLCQKHPKRSFAWAILGVVYSQQKESKKAMAAFDKAIKYNPSNVFAYHSRAQLWRKLKRPEKALQDRHKARQLMRQRRQERHIPHNIPPTDRGKDQPAPSSPSTPKKTP